MFYSHLKGLSHKNRSHFRNQLNATCQNYGTPSDQLLLLALPGQAVTPRVGDTLT